MTSLLVSLIIGSQELLMSPLNDGDLTRINLPASINIMLAIFVGYLVGQIFDFLEPVMTKLWIRTIFISLRRFVPFFVLNFGNWT